MQSLLKTKFNWPVFLAIAFFIYVLNPYLSFLSFFALLITLHQFMLAFFSIRYIIPVRYLFGAIMCIQMLLGPTLAYNGLDEYQYFMYKMAVPESQYFGYAIPATLAFIIGLHITAGMLKGEILNQKEIVKYVRYNPTMPYILIGVGFVSSVLASFVPQSLDFVFYLLGGAKYIGVFMIILGGKKLKVLPLILVYGSIIGSSLGAGMFHDLITWLVFLLCVYAIKIKASTNLKLIGASVFTVLILTIQLLKGKYREDTRQGQEAGIETFANAYKQSTQNQSFFNMQSLAENNVRINQGFIITNIMKTVPDKVPFSNGEEMGEILQAALLPRLLAPNKLQAGDRYIVLKYSGIPLRSGTSMALSSMGDAYINFGVSGGVVFMFFLGLLYSEVLKAFNRHSKKFPILLLFTPLVFYYPIRPDCELQTILGHLVKSCFLIFVVFTIWKKQFRVFERPIELKPSFT